MVNKSDYPEILPAQHLQEIRTVSARRKWHYTFPSSIYIIAMISKKNELWVFFMPMTSKCEGSENVWIYPALQFPCYLCCWQALPSTLFGAQRSLPRRCRNTAEQLVQMAWRSPKELMGIQGQAGHAIPAGMSVGLLSGWSASSLLKAHSHLRGHICTFSCSDGSTRVSALLISTAATSYFLWKLYVLLGSPGM